MRKPKAQGDPVAALSAHDRWQVLAASTGRSMAWLMARDLRCADQIGATEGHGAAALARRMAQQVLGGRPLAQVVGEAGFFGRTFWVSSDTLIPRSDSECLIEASLAWLAEPAQARHTPLRVLDLGTGTGCLAITLALEARARGWSMETVATDLSPRALRLARDNARWLGAEVRFFQGDWAQALPQDLRGFHLIVSNPPYLAATDPHLMDQGLQHEPRLALVGLAQDDLGLSAYPHLVQAARVWLEPGGALLVEHGWTQQPAVMALLRDGGLSGVRGIQDLAGRPRAVFAHL